MYTLCFLNDHLDVFRFYRIVPDMERLLRMISRLASCDITVLNPDGDLILTCFDGVVRWV